MNNNIIELKKFKADKQLQDTMLRLLNKYDVPNPSIHPKILEALRCFKEKK